MLYEKELHGRLNRDSPYGLHILLMVSPEQIRVRSGSITAGTIHIGKSRWEALQRAIQLSTLFGLQKTAQISNKWVHLRSM